MGGMGGGEGGPPKAKAGFRKVRGLGEVKPVFSERGGGRTSVSRFLFSLFERFGEVWLKEGVGVDVGMDERRE